VLAVDFSCTLPCSYQLRVLDAQTSEVVAATEGKAVGGQTSTLPAAGLAAGTYEYALRVFKCGKPGTATTRYSRPFTLPTTTTVDAVAPTGPVVAAAPVFPTLLPTVPAAG